jgi:Tol biopolymer transport system component
VTTVTDSVARNSSPAWSPDGKWLYFVSNRDGPSDIYRIPAGARGPIERLTVGLGAQSISLSADGRRLAYNVYQRVANAWSVPMGRRPMGLAGATQVTRGNQSVENLVLSRDERTLYYASDLSGNAQLYRIPSTGGEAERLATDEYQDFSPVPSSDGRRILFHSARTGSRDIYELPLDGGPLVQLTSSPDQELLPSWSPDGSVITYGLLNGRGAIRILRRGADGSFGRPVQRADFGISPKFSPDGRSIIFGSSPVGGWVFVVPTDSGPPRALVDTLDSTTPSAAFPAFSSDGREVLFAGRDARHAPGIWAVPFPAGGKPELVLRYDDPAHPPLGPYWTLGRNRLFVVLQEAQSDIWVLETSGL